MTLADVSVPETLPEVVPGQVGVVAATEAGAGAAVVWHSHTEMPPATPGWPTWMCDCVTLPARLS